jgi:hypothetical protein
MKAATATTEWKRMEVLYLFSNHKPIQSILGGDLSTPPVTPPKRKVKRRVWDGAVPKVKKETHGARLVRLSARRQVMAARLQHHKEGIHPNELRKCFNNNKDILV